MFPLVAGGNFGFCCDGDRCCCLASARCLAVVGGKDGSDRFLLVPGRMWTGQALFLLVLCFIARLDVHETFFFAVFMPNSSA